MEPLVRYQARAGVAEIELATRASGNSLTPEAAEQLDDCIRRASEDTDCRVAVIKSEGPKFCTGMDLASPSHGARAFASALLRICESPKPFVASIEGDAIAGGLGLVAACDIVISQHSAQFALTEAIVGMAPFVISPFLLRRMMPGMFASLALSTRLLTAEDASQRGLVDEVCDGTALNRQLDRLLRCSPPALERIKRVAHHDAALRPHVEAALEELETWLEQPELRKELSDFANGFAPSWFTKYKPAGVARP